MKIKEPIILLNFKAYSKANDKNAIKLARVANDIAKKYGISIIVAPQFHDLKDIRKFKKIFVFSQHIDPIETSGAFTGHIVLENILKFVDGSLLNHSEKKIPLKEIKMGIEILRKFKKISVVCASNVKEAKKIAKLNPDYIAIEPPELIGSGISVSKAKPQIITKTIEEVKKVNRKVKVLCGAGISNEDDVKRALELGAKGVLIASAFVKSKNPKLFLEKIAKVIKNFK